MDYLPGHEDWIRELAARHPWDYFIGSVHYVSESWDIDNPAKLSEWKKRDAFEVWSAYFDRLTLAAESRLFEIIGHCRSAEEIRHPPGAGLHAALRKISRRRRESRLRHRTEHRRPAQRLPGNLSRAAQILQLAFENRVPITFGSDAHAPGEVGMNFAEAIALARSVGYTETCRFNQRRREIVKL